MPEPVELLDLHTEVYMHHEVLPILLVHATKGGDPTSQPEKTPGGPNLSGEMARVVPSRNAAGQQMDYI